MKRLILLIVLLLFTFGVLQKLRSIWSDSYSGRSVLILLGLSASFYFMYQLRDVRRMQQDGRFGELKGEAAFWQFIIFLSSLIVGLVGGWIALGAWIFGLGFFWIMIDLQ